MTTWAFYSILGIILLVASTSGHREKNFANQPWWFLPTMIIIWSVVWLPVVIWAAIDKIRKESQ